MNRKLNILIGLLFVLSLFAACTGSAPAEENTQAANEQAQEETAQTADEKATDEVTKELEEDLAESLLNTLSGNVQYSVVYDYTSTYDGETMGGELGMFYKGENFRTDSKITYDGKPMETRMIVKETESITCTKDGDWTCFELAYDSNEVSTEESAPSDAVMDTEESIPDYTIKKLPSRTVAGTKADCYEFVYKPGVEDYDATFKQEYCISKEGVPLYIDMSSEGMTSKMVAKSYKTSVSDSEFVPPASPQSMEDLYQGYNLPEGYDMPSYE